MRRSSGARLLALLAAGSLVGACASARGGAAPLGRPQDPWELPPGATGTQRLYRVEYAGPEGSGTLKLTLRLAAADRFVVHAADPLGRAVWALAVGAPEALWVDHRGETVCRDEPTLELPGWAQGLLPAAALPAVLLGALPVTPVASERRDGALTAHDASGRRWTAEVADGVVRSWVLWQGDEPSWWWQRRGRGGVLSQRGRNRQLRWQEVVAEPLTGAVTLSAPAGYLELCRSGSPAPSGEGEGRR